MATLTSTGAVNLTSSTNWSPAQTPAAGDDLVIGAHTLTLDADFVANTITFNNSSSKFAISGTTRTLQATNGFFVTASSNAPVCTTDIAAGITVTTIGKWTNNPYSKVFNLTGGTVNAQTVSANPASMLFYANGNYGGIVNTFTSGTLNTIGYIDYTGSPGSTVFLLPSGGGASVWNHNNTGAASVFINGGKALSGSATGLTLNWTGNLNSFTQSASVIDGSFSKINTSGTWTQASSPASVNSVTYLVSLTGGTWEHTGVISAKNRGFVASLTSGASFYWKNQTRTIQSDEGVYIYATGGTLDFSGLSITNNGKISIVAIGNSSIVSDANTLITNTSTAASACVFGNTQLDAKIITLASPSPALPSAGNVTAGVQYGYAGTLITGTGLVLDPATLTNSLTTALQSAISPNAPVAVTRSISDTKSITFSWPVSGATITAQKSVDNGAYSAASGTVSFLRTENSRHYYTLSYNAADRTATESTIRYKLTDGTYTRYFNLRLTTVRTELNTELTRIDTAVSTRQAASTFAADTRTAVGLASANLDTQLSGLASDIDNINVDFTPVINTLSDIKGTGWTSTDSLKAISDSVDGLVTTGLNPNPLTVTVQSSGSPVAGVAVSVRSGNTVVAWGRTNASGQVVFGLAAGSYSVLVLSSAYYQTPTPQNVTIPTASTLSIELTQQSILPPSMPGLCTVRFSVVHQGAFVSGAEVTAEIDTMNSTVDTALVARTKTTGVTGQSGYVDLILIRSDAFSFGGAYRVNVSDANGTKLYSRYVRVPNVSSCFADDLIAV